MCLCCILRNGKSDNSSLSASNRSTYKFQTIAILPNRLCFQLPTCTIDSLPPIFKYLAYDVVVADDAVAALYSMDTELSAGHDVVQQVPHLKGGQIDKFLRRVCFG